MLALSGLEELNQSLQINMNEIEFKVGGSELLDSISPLWMKLNNHHANISSYFSDQFHSNSFSRRKIDLIQKSSEGLLRVEIAKTKTNSINVGYCVGTIYPDKVGEVDSIYVEKPFRKQGIANHLMKNVLNWMNNQDVKQKRVVVASGNEDVFSFYERYSFFPRTSTLICKR